MNERKIHVWLNEHEQFQFESDEGTEQDGMVMPATAEAVARLFEALARILESKEMDPEATPLRYFKVKHEG